MVDPPDGMVEQPLLTGYIVIITIYPVSSGCSTVPSGGETTAFRVIAIQSDRKLIAQCTMAGIYL